MFTPLFYGTVNQLLINLVPFIRDALLELINPILHDPPDLLINRIRLNVHFFSGKSLIVRRALFFCKIELNVYLLQKTSLL